MYDSYMQGSAMAHTANVSVTTLEEVFARQVSHFGLWPYRSPDLDLCNYYLWGKLEDRVYVNISHCLHGLKGNTGREIANISRQTACHVSRNILRCEACLEYISSSRLFCKLVNWTAGYKLSLEFLVHAGFVYDDALITAAKLWIMIKNPPCRCAGNLKCHCSFGTF
jgi:hypothetical protein